MTTVVASGVFDIIHPGHIMYLTEAKKLGDRLIVIVARDETTEARKRKPFLPEAQRLTVVSALKPVDEAVLGDHKDFLKPIREIKPHVIALGPDQEVDEKKLREKLGKHGINCEIVRINAHWHGPMNSSKKIHEKIKKI
ncbi:MAG: adenylyltransferase/cytidyltransferase family protein [Candidatus Altiarchaeota archaeon]